MTNIGVINNNRRDKQIGEISKIDKPEAKPNSDLGSNEAPETLSPEALARAKLVSETAKIAWRDLQRFFANGSAMFVAPELDLVEAAYQISADSAEQIKSWQTDRLLGSVTDEQAIEWLETNAAVWSVVVRPWVLVQVVSDDS